MIRHRYAWVLIPLLLSGCAGDDMRDLEAFVNQVKAREPTPIEPLPEIKQIETFAYVPSDRRDPFLPSQEDAQETEADTGSGIAPDPLRRKEELEQFPLDSLRMMGTLEQEQTTWGLVMVQKDGALFRVRPGNYMGQNHGQIIRIGEDRIELTEIVTDGQGGWQERKAEVALSE